MKSAAFSSFQSAAAPEARVGGERDDEPECHIRTPYDGGPAIPSHTVYPDGRETFFAGVTVRDYFAARAPKVPDWYVHTPAPGHPGEPPMPKRERPPTFEQSFGPEVYAERAAYNAEFAAMAPQRDAHQKLVHAWQVRDKMARLVQWRYEYADAMLAARANQIREE